MKLKDVLMRKANFFIVGASKCGTTAMSEYLRSHPQVFMTTPKEPSYFAYDFPGIRYVATSEQYDQLFSQAPDSAVVMGEASPCYFHSLVAIENIYAYNPSAKLIVMLRNPLDMLGSYHAQLVFSMFEDQKSLEKAWRLQDERAAGRAIPARCREPKLLRYRHVVSFGDHLERLYRLFPREQVKVIFYEDFQRDPGAAYREVLAFLGLVCDGRDHFPTINTAKVSRWEWLNRLLHSPPGWALAIMRRLSGTRTHDLVAHLHRRIKAYNSLSRRPAGLSDALREELAFELAPQIDKLERLLGVSLQHWRQRVR